MGDDRALGGTPQMALDLIGLSDVGPRLLSRRATTGTFFKTHQSNKLFGWGVPGP